MEDSSGTHSDVVLEPKSEGHDFSFTSNGSINSRNSDRYSHGSLNRISYSQLGRNFTDIPDCLEEDDNDSDGKLEYDTSGLAIPRLRTSMTPWRSQEKPGNMESKQSSPTNSRPTTRSSLFSVDGGFTIASTTGSNEVEQLQKQLTTYKLKVRTLLELIKQLNYGDNENDKKVRDSFYGKLLATFSQSDELGELKKVITELEDKNNEKQKLIITLQDELSAVREQLQDTKNEHAETLEYANEYLEHSEVLAKSIDDMLSLLMESFDTSAEEKDALQKARQISSSFAMVKMNAVMSTLRRVLNQVKTENTFQDTCNEDGSSVIAAIANSTAVDAMDKSSLELSSGRDEMARQPSNVLDESVIDTRLEIAIEGLHEEYDRFIQGIREKVELSANLEGLLLNKLSEQDKLLGCISSKVLSEAKKDNQKAVDIGNVSSKEEIATIVESYQKHIDSLNSLIYELKNSLLEKNEDLQLHKDKLLELDKIRKNEHRSRTELQDFKELSKVKERNWENFTNDLEKNINALQNEKVELLDMVDQLNAELDTREDEIEILNGNLKKNVKCSINQLGVLKKENQNLEHLLSEYTNKMTILKDERSNLQEIVVELKKRKTSTQKEEADLQRFKQHLVLHLETMFATFGKILQKKSIDQSNKKLEYVRHMDGIHQLRQIQSKLESLYNFMETALESIIDSYMRLVIAEKDKSTQAKSNNQVELQFRIDELERKWISERERRKLDNDAADGRINQLEAENELLKDKLYNMTIRR